MAAGAEARPVWGLPHVAAVAVVVAAAAVSEADAIVGMPAGTLKALALVLAAIAAWATGIVPGHVTAIAFFAVAMLAGVAPAAVVFSGFTSTAFWLIFGGLVLGLAIRNTGFGEVVAHRLARLFGQSYSGTVAGLLLLGVGLSFVMPSSLGRAALLIPIALAVADRLGFSEGTRGRMGIVVATAFGTHVPSFAILPANVPNVVLAANAASLFGVQLSFGHYLLLHFPILGALKALVILGLVLILFPDRAVPSAEAGPVPPRPLTRDQRRLGMLLLASMVLMCTDDLHHLSPAWISLGAAVLCLLPPLALVPMAAVDKELNHGALLHVAGLIGLGAVVSASGLGGLVAHRLIEWLPLAAGEAARNFTVLSGLSMVVGLLTTLPGTPAVLTPLAGDLAAASGLPPEAVLMLQVVGFSTVLAPYQSPPLVVSLHLAKQPVAPLLKFWAALLLLTALVLLPLDYLWWRLLGAI